MRLCRCAAYGTGYGPGPVSYDGFYDSYYGPIYDGYWDGDLFYYRRQNHGRYFADKGNHFRRDMGGLAVGDAPMNGHGAPSDGTFRPMHGVGPGWHNHRRH